MFIVYCAASPSGKVYVGMTKRGLAKRKQYHGYAARNGSSHAIHCAIRKYGDQMEWFELHKNIETEEEASLLEQMCIQELNCTYPNGYNLTSGGEGIPNFPITQEYRNKLSKAHKGRKHSAETRAKISASKKGRPEIAAQLASVRFDPTGRKLSEEHRAKISAACRGRKRDAWSEETRQKQIEVQGTAIEDQYGNRYPSIKDAARKLNIRDTLIHRVLKNVQKQTHGYKFRYVA